MERVKTRMKTLRIRRMIPFCLFLFAAAFIYFCTLKVYADEKPVVIVLDPGHGGTDIGAITKGRMEKELNYRVAMACKRELEKYEGVKVYLSRDKDEEKTLMERAVFAYEKKADLVISLHFNASESHLLSGAETYVSSKQPLKAKAEKFALNELSLLEQYGVPIHGNFTRLNESNLDYYGIIRESASRGMPTVIVEHCYLDVPAEERFFDTPDDLERFGIIDATAVAMTYGLRSKELGVDYSNQKNNEPILPQHVYRKDTSSPEVTCEFVKYDYNLKKAVFDITLNDPECEVTSFGVSIDNGKTYSPFRNLYFDEQFEFEYIIKDCEDANVIIGVYNAFGVFGYSQPIAMSDYVESEVVEAFASIEFPQSQSRNPSIFSFRYMIDIIQEMNELFYLLLFIVSALFGICATVVLTFLKRTGLYI